MESGRQQSVDWREERAARAGRMDTKYLWSTQVRFLLPSYFLKSSLCFTGKEKYCSASKVEDVTETLKTRPLADGAVGTRRREAQRECR